MNKSAIALSVVAALAASAAAQAETTFYGRISTAIAYIDPDGGDDVWDLVDSGSRFGVKGTEDLGNGLSAVYQLEIDINADRLENARQFDGRLAFVGLKGGFGQVTLGSQWSHYYDSLGVADIFNEASWYSHYQGPFRQRNSVRYDIPDSLGGFGGGVQFSLDGDSDGSLVEVGICSEATDEACRADDVLAEEIDEWQVAVRYSGGPFFVGAAYRNIEVDTGSGVEVDDADQFGIGASFDFLGASIAAVYEHTEFDDDETDVFYLTGQYKFGNNILKAGYGLLDPDADDLDNLIDGDDDDNEDDIYEWAVGFQHNLGSRTRVWLEYQDQEDEGSFATLGLRHDW